MKWLIYLIFVVLFLGVTFFGIGPVLMADGSMLERMMTLAVVLVIYAVLAGAFYKWKKKENQPNSES